MKINQKGFGAVEILLVIIALTLIVGVGFYITNTGKNNNKEANATNSEVAKSAVANEAKQQVPKNTDEELIIEAVKKAGIENADGTISAVQTAKVNSVIGNNANGSAGLGAEGGGFAYIAHKTNGKWVVVYKGQQLPGKDIGEKYKLPADWYDANY